jgi:hypothetical protein
VKAARASVELDLSEEKRVATGEEEQNKEERKGFAGISSLVSDVDTSLPPPTTQEVAASDAAPNAERRAASESQQPEQNLYQAPSQPSSGSAAGKWMLGIAAVVGMFWLIGEADKSPSSPAPYYSPPARSTTPSYSAAPAQPQVPSRPDEAKPPVGQDLIFSTAQIRYCLAQDVRIEGARSAINNYSDADVDRFNAMVADYNSRCSSFRYRSGALESARRDVEPYRSQLLAEGRSRFVRSPSLGSLSMPVPTRPVADETVRAVQQKLNELGYNAGPADGLMGRGTRAAIIAFQQDRGLAATGVADQALLIQLQQDLPRTSRPLQQSRSANSPPSYSSSPTTYTEQGRQNQMTLTADERSSIELACIIAKSQGPAAYNDCVNEQLRQLSSAPRTPSLASISYGEKSAIELACITAKSAGAASYNRCLVSQIRELESGPRQPSLSGLSYDEKSAIELACITAKSDGAARHNRCLIGQLRELQNAPRTPNLNALSYQERSSIQLACITERANGAAAYNRCLTMQLRSIGR